MPTSLEIKTIILGISGLSGNPNDLAGDTKLSELGFNTHMCTNLENALRAVSTKTIPVGAVTSSKTVDQIIALAP
jgi:hypothetical protein